MTLWKSLAGHSAAVTSVAISHNGRLLASASVDRTVKLWDLMTGGLLKEFNCGQPMSDVAFSPNSQCVAATTGAGKSLAWSCSNGNLIWGELIESSMDGGRCPLVFSPDGRTLVSGGKSILLIDALDGSTLRLISEELGSHVSLAFSSDANILGSCTFETGAINLWDTRTWQPIRIMRSRPFEFDGHELGQKIWGIDISDSVLASAGDDEVVTLWDVTTGQMLASFQGHDWYLFDVKFSPNGTSVASAGADQTVRLWRVNTGEQLACLRVLPPEDGGHGAYRIAFAPSGNALAAACSDNTVKIWAW